MPSLQDSIDPASIVRGHALHQAIQVENDGSGNAILVGWAIPGALTSEARWRICQIAYTPATSFIISIKWANGVIEYRWKWDDRNNGSIIVYS